MIIVIIIIDNNNNNDLDFYNGLKTIKFLRRDQSYYVISVNI